MTMVPVVLSYYSFLFLICYFSRVAVVVVPVLLLVVVMDYFHFH
ncbi:TPA: hypothetical protein ACH6JN_002603 [Yersinia enterocolitica]